MKLLVLRHGDRAKTARPKWKPRPRHVGRADCPCPRCEDRRSSLTALGERQAEECVLDLELMKVEISRIYHSEYEHARQTARLLASKTPKRFEPLPELNPGTESEEVLPALVRRLAELAARTPAPEVVALVGHEPLLGQVVAAATGRRIRPLGQLEVVCVTADSLRELLQGRASLAWRFPARAYEEPALREKIRSKMTVATFLAGFSFTALMAILLRDGFEANLLPATPSVDEVLFLLASFLLAAATALFVVTIYVYDRLGMPEGFWSTSRAGPWSRWTLHNASQRNEYGELYTLMIDAWVLLFTPAVVLAAAGLLLVVLAVGTIETAIVYLLVLVAAVLYYDAARPRLGVD